MIRLPTVPSHWIVPRRVYRPRGGSRGEALTDLQLVCGAGPYEVDVLVREQTGRPRLDIVGQITRSGRIFEPVAELRLELVEASSAELVGRTDTDEFGEFDFESARVGVLGLRIGETPNAPTVLLWEEEAA